MNVTTRLLIRNIVSVALLATCATGGDSRAPKVRTHFVPPSPRPPAPAAPLEPIEVDSGYYSKELPGKSAPMAQRSFEADMRMRRADQHFQKGSQLLSEGKGAEAREEFDRAVDLLVSAPGHVPDRDRLLKRFESLVEAIYRLEAEASAQSGPEQEPVFDKAPHEDIADLTFPVDPKLSPLVREQVQATVSQLPLEVADPVLAFINYFSSPRGRKAFLYGLQRSGRYAPMIRRILDEEGLPQELIHMAQAESAFLPRAVSRMRAAGMWQFVKFRGNEYGLKQNMFFDDRLDPEKATRAAARHLRDLYTEFGDWYLAIAAYNCGPGNVDKAIQRTGYADFWELYKRNVLPRETANYLPIILAMTIMAKNPKAYGLEGIQFDEPLTYDTIELAAPTHLALLADITGKPLSLIRELNPAVLKLVAPAGHAVHVPKGSSNSVIAALDTVPEARRASWRLHRVGSAETLSALARQYRTTEKQIFEANGVTRMEPEAGDLLVIPVSYPGPPAEPVTAKAKAKSKKQTKAVAKTGKQTSRPASRTASAKKPAPAKAATASRKQPPSKKPVVRASTPPPVRAQTKPPAQTATLASLR